MKNLIQFTVFFSVLFLGVCIGFMIADDINTDNNQVIKKTIDSLQTKLSGLEKFKRYGISVGDTTLTVITNLKIQGKNHKKEHIVRIKKGYNKYYFVLRENVAIDLIVMKYK